MKNSSKMHGDFVLAPGRGAIPASRLRAFLVQFANLPDSPKSLDRFYRNFADMLLSIEDFKNSCRIVSRKLVQSPKIPKWMLKQLEQPPPTDAEYQEQLFRSCYRPLRHRLQSAWIAEDRRTKFWLLRDLAEAGDAWSEGRPFILSSMAFVNGPIPVSLPPPSAFEQVVIYLLRAADRTRVCKNPECSAPYFFASRRTQAYCSEDCALPAQREFKRRWWQKHGQNWRKNRSRKEARP